MEILIYTLIFFVLVPLALFIRKKVLLLPFRGDVQSPLMEHLANRFSSSSELSYGNKTLTLKRGPLLPDDEHFWLHARFKTPLPSTFSFTLTGHMTLGGVLTPKSSKYVAPCEVDFDSRFKILTSDSAPFKSLLESQRGSALIIKLYEFGGSHDTSITLSDGVLTVSTPYIPKQGPEMEGFFRLAGAFATAIEAAYDKRSQLLTRDGFSLLVDELEHPKSQKSKKLESDVCQYCGKEIFSDEVLCTLCLAPHHQDCWQTNKGCATFGCGYQWNSLSD